MALQTAYPDESGIPEQYRELYTRTDDGIWRLSGIEGIRTSEETRELETALQKEQAELASLKKLFDAIGEKPENLAAYAEEHERLRAGLSEAKEKLASCTAQLKQETVEKTLRRAAAEMGVRPEAVSDVLARAASFEVDDSGSVVIRKNGETLSPVQWLEKQLKKAPHWLAPSQSAGIRGFAGSSSHRHSAPATIAELVSKSWNNNKRS